MPNKKDDHEAVLNFLKGFTAPPTEQEKQEQWMREKYPALFIKPKV